MSSSCIHLVNLLFYFTLLPFLVLRQFFDCESVKMSVLRLWCGMLVASCGVLFACYGCGLFRCALCMDFFFFFFNKWIRLILRCV